jgi:5-amino-6-(5-phosphoribosylamino)uracil reductase
MSADGKIADAGRSPARFGSAIDKQHLEARIAEADGVLFGAGTLRAYGTTLSVRQPDLLDQRQQRGQPLQPIQIVCSQSVNLDPDWPFFRQPVPRWLLTASEAAGLWQEQPGFERVISVPATETGLDWAIALSLLQAAGIARLAVTGGGQLVAALLAIDAIDEFWLTLCPLLLGGSTAPTPVEGSGFMAAVAPRLELLSVRAIAQEVFLHYQVQR